MMKNPFGLLATVRTDSRSSAALIRLLQKRSKRRKNKKPGHKDRV